MIELIKNLFEHKTVALLGFGREGRSTYKLIRKVLPSKVLTIIDENVKIINDNTFRDDMHVKFITGKDCMNRIDDFEIAVKSPGIPSNSLPTHLKRVILSSQTDIFLQAYGRQVIGITGTKGKSTTSSLVYHILKNAGKNTMLVGNIGIPPFDCVDEITPDTVVVMELSSHQLEYVSHAPHIAVLLNLFQEHLDHYYTYEDYKSAKFNIGRYQSAGDYFIYNRDNETLLQLIEKSGKQDHYSLSFSLEASQDTALYINGEWIEMKMGDQITKLYNLSGGQPLKGHHNLYNIMAAASATYLAGVSPSLIEAAVKTFNGLEHRIERVGTYAGIVWYNDSIATIPEATIEAVKTLETVDTLILGGFDRGIEYDILYPFLASGNISNIIFVGEAGRRMMQEFNESGSNEKNIYTANDYLQVVDIARSVTRPGRICLLSPAAASYDMFKNFEERGNTYKKNVRDLDPSHS